MDGNTRRLLQRMRDQHRSEKQSARDYIDRQRGARAGQGATPRPEAARRQRGYSAAGGSSRRPEPARQGQPQMQESWRRQQSDMFQLWGADRVARPRTPRRVTPEGKLEGWVRSLLAQRRDGAAAAAASPSEPGQPPAAESALASAMSGSVAATRFVVASGLAEDCEPVLELCRQATHDRQVALSCRWALRQGLHRLVAIRYAQNEPAELLTGEGAPFQRLPPGVLGLCCEYIPSGARGGFRLACRLTYCVHTAVQAYSPLPYTTATGRTPTAGAVETMIQRAALAVASQGAGALADSLPSWLPGAFADLAAVLPAMGLDSRVAELADRLVSLWDTQQQSVAYCACDLFTYMFLQMGGSGVETAPDCSSLGDAYDCWGGSFQLAAEAVAARAAGIRRSLERIPTFDAEEDERLTDLLVGCAGVLGRAGDVNALYSLLGERGAQHAAAQVEWIVRFGGERCATALLLLAVRCGCAPLAEAAAAAAGPPPWIDRDGRGVPQHWLLHGAARNDAFEVLVPSLTEADFLARGREAMVQLFANAEGELPRRDGEWGAACSRLISRGLLPGGYPLWWALRATHRAKGAAARAALQEWARDFVAAGASPFAPLGPGEGPGHLPALSAAQLAAICDRTRCAASPADLFEDVPCTALDRVAALQGEFARHPDSASAAGPACGDAPAPPAIVQGEAEVDDWEQLA
eukprot:TRINITY_DN5257_c0_g1_i1.p1 TRINITY_DN5257_c0_g1~~TRINITY_DN5257_c0_g1_i1.p1  ORF type:complete len:727 (+),score=180.18 TRINITY_DN5257_c0_g1_i1:98-2182(+)